MNNYSLPKSSETQKKVAVVGPRGYSGQELVRVLLKHPGVELKVCFINDKGWKAEDEITGISESVARALQVVSVTEWKKWVGQLDLVFLATPHEASIHHAREFLDAGISVIDLSGAFRLNSGSEEDQKAVYRKFYQIEHSDLDLLAQAQYGLTPWCGPIRRNDSGKPVLITNPGCYATAISMALIPLLQAGVIEADSVVIDAKSGTTGAGRKAAENLLLAEAAESCAPYRVGKHQHLPEIRQTVQQFSGVAIDPFMTTHLLPIRRGISAGIYARPGSAIQNLSDADASQKIGQILTEAYASYPLVKISDLNTADRAQALLSLNKISQTPNCHLVYGVQGGKVYVFSMIDNLMKGAATQAVENLNRWLDLPLATGLQ